MNILVTADFLKLEKVYEMAWQDYFLPKFNSVIDQCNLDLTTMSARIVGDIAKKISLADLLALRDRNDKLISNIFRHRIDDLVAPMQFF